MCVACGMWTHNSVFSISRHDTDVVYERENGNEVRRKGKKKRYTISERCKFFIRIIRVNLLHIF